MLVEVALTILSTKDKYLVKLKVVSEITIYRGVDLLIFSL